MEKKNDVKDLKEEKDVKDEKKEHNSADAKIEALIEMGKSKGVLTYKEVMDTLDELELDSEQIERIYDRFEALNIDVVEEMEIPDDITSDISELESDLGSTEGVAIDDPVRMYLKEIGKVSLLRMQRSNWQRLTCVWWYPLRSATLAAECCSWTLFRRAIWAL